MATGTMVRKASRDTTKAIATRVKSAKFAVQGVVTDSGVDVAAFNLKMEPLIKIYGIVNQTGEYKGKRFAGAESHEAADQLATLYNKVIFGSDLPEIVA